MMARDRVVRGRKGTEQMARYAQLFANSQAQLRKTESRLVDAEHYKETYRLFINEAGHADEFLRWLAKREGLDLDCLKPPSTSGE